MKGTFIFLAFLMAICVNQASAQLCHCGYFNYFGNNDTLTSRCVVNSNRNIKTFQNCTAYQTFNNQWDGIQDSNRCFDIVGDRQFKGYWNVAIIKIDDIDTNKAIFVKVDLDSANQLSIDNVKAVSASYGSSWIPKQYSYGNSCAEGYCSEVLFRMTNEDIAGNFISYTWQAITAMTVSINEADADDVFFDHLYTSGFPKCTLDQIIYKIRPKNARVGDSLEIGEVMIGEIINGISEHTTPTETLAIIGNPVDNQLCFTFQSSNNKKMTMEIYNLDGKAMIQKTIFPQIGINKEYIQLSQIIPNTYILRISDGEHVQRKPFTKL